MSFTQLLGKALGMSGRLNRISVGTLVVCGLVASFQGGCGSTGTSSRESTGPAVTSMFASRPRVPTSVVEAHPGAGADQLDFFDDLEKRDVVSHDDALHACLLIFTGQSAPTYVQRASRAKQFGLLNPKFDRPPREAATLGEIAQMIAVGMKLTDTSESGAFAELQSTNIFPANAIANQGVSGSQMLTILGHVEDALAGAVGSEAAPRSALPAPLAPAERHDVASMAVFQPDKKTEKKPIKKPVLDLEKEAKKPRDGQVVPDTAAPVAETPRPPAPTPAVTPAPAATPTPEQKPEIKPVPLPPPPPAAHGAEVPRADGVASDLRYVALDKVAVVPGEVLGPREYVQWRVVDDGRGKPGPWATLTPETKIDDRVELRTGMGVKATITVNETTQVTLYRLSRVRIERKVRSDGQSQLGITMLRGKVEIAPDPAAVDRAVIVKTPDSNYPLRNRALFVYDAYSGTTAREFR